MSNLSVSAPSTQAYCLVRDKDTGKLVSSTFDFAELLKMEEEHRANPVGTKTLTSEGIQALAQKYNPNQMTQSDYNSLINDLVSQGVLSHNETYNIGNGLPGAVYIRLGAQCQVGGSRREALPPLSNFDGNAMAWLEVLRQKCDQQDTIQKNALQKVSRILNQMAAQRNSWTV